MITRVFGKKIENVYDVICNTKQVEDNDGNMKTVYTAKPQINKVRKVKEWSELCSYEGEPRYNSGISTVFGYPNIYPNINISENETVKVTEEPISADDALDACDQTCETTEQAKTDEAAGSEEN